MNTARNTVALAGGSLGAIYGLFTISSFSFAHGNAALASFLALVPAALGFLPLAFVDDAQVPAFRNTLFIPWVSLIGILITMASLHLESLVIVAIAAPFILVITLVTWIIQAAGLWRLSRRKRFLASLSFLVLPFLAASWEGTTLASTSSYEVTRSITIRASTERAWRAMREANAVDWREYGTGVFGALGTPNPAHLGHAEHQCGPASVTFSDGDRWEQDLSTIDPAFVERAAPDGYLIVRRELPPWPCPYYGPFLFETRQPPRTVRLRRYEYTLARMRDGRSKVTLSVRYALATRINTYAGPWLAAVVDDTAERLLADLKHRAERGP